MIAAEGEQKASRALRDASEVIAESSAALQLRYLQVTSSAALQLRYLQVTSSAALQLFLIIAESSAAEIFFIKPVLP